jgi:hypothetical protein
MAKTCEDYRLALQFRGRRYKALGHSVREDETLQVRFRSRPGPRRAGRGNLVMTAAGVTVIDSGGPEAPRINVVHYHPSGRINFKQRDGTFATRIQGPPLQMLRAPICLAYLSPAFIDQLDLEDKKFDGADCLFDLDKFALKRIQIELHVGPKGAFDGPLERSFGVTQRIVYRDAGLYDVAYFVGEAAPIDETAMIGGVKLALTCLSGVVSEIEFDPTAIPALPDSVWSSPPAVYRQIRAFLETSFEVLRTRVGSPKGGYEIRVTLCNDGAVAGVNCHDKIDGVRCSFNWYETLSRSQVLAILGAATGGDGTIADVNEIDSRLCSGFSGTIFVRQRHSAGPQRVNALVFNANEPPADSRPYWRIPPSALKKPAEIINLVAAN